MTNDEFCKIDTAFYGDVVDNIKQIRLRSFTGEELKEYVEAAINYTHCCTELKTLKQGEKLILDNKFDVEVVAPSEKNVLIKYKETDKVVWVNEQRLKRN